MHPALLFASRPTEAGWGQLFDSNPDHRVFGDIVLCFRNTRRRETKGHPRNLSNKPAFQGCGLTLQTRTAVVAGAG
jgi:hypothetical protein